jgi:hypothetical protein
MGSAPLRLDERAVVAAVEAHGLVCRDPQNPHMISNGRYTIQRNGVVLIRGRETETTTTISFGHETGPAACTGALGAATYRWSIRAGLLRLTTVREGCLGRHVVLTTHPLKKVD